jgi:hypothetical protein
MAKRSITIISIIVALAAVFGTAGYFILKDKNAFKADVPSTVPTIKVTTTSPANVGVNDTITASVIVEGAGQNFTSFKATVSTTNLTVTGFTLDPGNVIKQWQATPSASSLSFFGGVYGQTTTTVTVYTITAKPVATGAASITITGGAIYQTDGFNVTNIMVNQTGATFNVQTSPTVSAGADFHGYPNVTTNPYTLNGSSTDATATLSWTKVSGPGTITFSNSTILKPTVIASLPGAYVLRLTATNAGGSTSATVNFTVHKTGDIDNDGLVDDDDFTSFLYNYTYFSNKMADFNNDNLANGLDFTLLMANWGK